MTLKYLFNKKHTVNMSETIVLSAIEASLSLVIYLQGNSSGWLSLLSTSSLHITIQLWGTILRVSDRYYKKILNHILCLSHFNLVLKHACLSYWTTDIWKHIGRNCNGSGSTVKWKPCLHWQKSLYFVSGYHSRSLLKGSLKLHLKVVILFKTRSNR